MASGLAVALTYMSVPQLVNYINTHHVIKIYMLEIESEFGGVNILTIKVCIGGWFLKLLYFNLTIIQLTQHRNSNSLEFTFVQKWTWIVTRLIIISVHQPRVRGLP